MSKQIEKNILFQLTNLRNNRQSYFKWIPLIALGVGIFLRYFLNIKMTTGNNNYTCTARCIICYTEGRQVIFTPCNHLLVCQECSQQIRNCPVCRRRIDGKYLLDQYIIFD